MPLLATSDHGPVRTLTISNPGRKNAIPPDGWDQLGVAFAAFAGSDQRVLVITGADGEFCSGADLADADFGPDFGVARNAAWMRRPGAAATTLHRLPKPTVAAVDGVAAGAGMNLALGCDIVIATERARFSEIFVRRGLTLDFGGTWLLPRVVGRARALDLALTGRLVGAAEALDMGLVARVVPVDELADTVTETAEALAAGAPLAQRIIKTGLDRSETMTFEQAIAYETEAQGVLLSSQDVTEALAAFLGKRPPRFLGR
ncbi:2-(1,2-epoxy-1,2-dihydrophenyl)acetyl-CoA isomerase PaaG [soil metagenome]